MILQCDQCNTKFRLDDSKLKPGGVKVRCSKCRHVFIAGAEVKQEESEFDALLSGLGAPAPEPPAQPAPGAGVDVSGFAFDEEPASAAAAPHAAPAAQEPPSPAAPSAAAPADAAAPPGSDFPDFDFSADGIDTTAQAPAPSAGPSAAPDFGDFDFEPAAPQAKEAAPDAAPASGLEFGEFSFDEEPPALREEPVQAPGESLDFGEFSFSDEPLPAAGEAEPQPSAGGLDFGEFEFDAEPAAQAQPAPAPAQGLDFGEFSFDEEPVAPQGAAPAAGAQQAAPAAGTEGFDLGAFSFNEEPPQLEEEAPVAGKPALEFGEFSFDEEPPPLQEEPPAASPFEAPAPAAPQAPSFEAAPAPFEFHPSGEQKGGGAGSQPGEFSFDDFPFSQSAEQQAPVAPAAPQAPVTTLVTEPIPDSAAATSGSAAYQAAHHREPDFDLGLGPVPTRVPDDFVAEDEELPPLSISSRRKGRSIVTVSIITISVLVIVALSGAGLYLLQSGPAAFDKLGLGFVAKWFGMESPEEGRVVVRNQQAAFYQNKEAGELFVVTGEAVNNFRKARASIHVKVNLYDNKGAVLMQKTAYCGNHLTADQLANLPMAKMDAIMNNQFGDSLANLGVQPGKAIGFVVAIPNVPKEAADFGVEVIGSTVAGK